MIYVLFLLLIHVFQEHAILFDCNFEMPCVDFKIDDNWNVTNGKNSKLIDHDHTLKNNFGSYLVVKSNNTLAKILTSDWIQPSYDQAICFQLWYCTSQLQFSFDIQLLQGDDENLISTVYSASGGNPPIANWTLFNVRLPSEKVKILIRLNITSGFLALDDLSVDFCNRVQSLPPKILFACDGESSCIEDFISLPDYPYQWSIIQANNAIEQENQAPATDYTFHNKSGHYFWLANSTSIRKGNVGYLATKRSFEITENISYCLNFAYYGYGEEQKSNLKIYARMVERPDIVEELWPKQNSQQYKYTYNNWTWGIINLPLGYYSLLFRMDSEDMKLSSFTLDNINITSCDYLPSEFISSQSHLSFSCNFDGSSICDIVTGYMASESHFNFTILTGDTIPNRELGPTYDYTTNSSSGGFVYWNRQSNFSEEDFGIFGPLRKIEQNADMCIKFAYYVKSSENDETITVLLLSATSSLTHIWAQMVNDSHGWQSVIIPLQDAAWAETFYFTVLQGKAIEISIAFDDIRFEQCSLINTTNITILSSSTTTTTITAAMTTITTAAATTTTRATVTTTRIFSSSTTLRNSSQKILTVNGTKLIIFCFLFIIIEEFVRK